MTYWGFCTVPFWFRAGFIILLFWAGNCFLVSSCCVYWNRVWRTGLAFIFWWDPRVSPHGPKMSFSGYFQLQIWFPKQLQVYSNPLTLCASVVGFLFACLLRSTSCKLSNVCGLRLFLGDCHVFRVSAGSLLTSCVSIPDARSCCLLVLHYQSR